MVTALETQSTPWKVSTNQAAVKQEHGDSVDIWFGTYILEYTDSSTSCSRVVEVPNGNASRRAVAPVPRATVRVNRTRMLSAAL